MNCICFLMFSLSFLDQHSTKIMKKWSTKFERHFWSIFDHFRTNFGAIWGVKNGRKKRHQRVVKIVVSNWRQKWSRITQHRQKLNKVKGSNLSHCVEIRSPPSIDFALVALISYSVERVWLRREIYAKFDYASFQNKHFGVQNGRVHLRWPNSCAWIRSIVGSKMVLCM